MDEFLAQLVVFAGLGNKHRIALKDGSTLQGWIMQIEQNKLDILVLDGHAECLRSLSLNQIEDAQLFYWDYLDSKWQQFFIK